MISLYNVNRSQNMHALHFTLLGHVSVSTSPSTMPTFCDMPPTTTPPTWRTLGVARAGAEERE